MSSARLTGIRANVADGFEHWQSFLRERPRLKLFLIVFPPALVLAVFFLLPLVFMAYLSLLEGMPPAPATFENYMRLVTQDVYLSILWQTTVITAQATILTVLIGYAIAYSMVRFSRRTTMILLLVIMPFWTNYIIRMYAWINILQTNGVLDAILMFAGAINEPLGVLYSHEAVLIGFIYIYLPLAILPFYASLSYLDQNLIEASMDLGAGPIKTFLSITLPMTKNGIMVGVILVGIPIFGSFITPQLLGGTDNTMIGMIIENQFVEAFNWSFGAAISITVALIVVFLLVVGMLAGGNFFDLGGEDE
jgi:spermidine/putrescine transport system permease protein